MAKPYKTGLDYFSHDTSMSECKKLKFLQIKYGLIGYAVYNKLLEILYKKDGYFMVWNQEDSSLFAYENHITEPDLTNIIEECFTQKLFSKELFLEHKILTSPGTQERYLLGCSRRKVVEIYEKYRLINIEEFMKNNKCLHSVNICIIKDNNESVNVNICPDNVNIYSQTETETETETETGNGESTHVCAREAEKCQHLPEHKPDATIHQPQPVPVSVAPSKPPGKKSKLQDKKILLGEWVQLSVRDLEKLLSVYDFKTVVYAIKHLEYYKKFSKPNFNRMNHYAVIENWVISAVREKHDSKDQALWLERWGKIRIDLSTIVSGNAELQAKWDAYQKNSNTLGPTKPPPGCNQLLLFPEGFEEVKPDPNLSPWGLETTERKFCDRCNSEQLWDWNPKQITYKCRKCGITYGKEPFINEKRKRELAAEAV